MAIPPESRHSPAPYRVGVSEATLRMREILDVSKEFQVHVGRELTVNATDLAAMELILMAGDMAPTDLAKRLGLSTAAVTTVVDRLVALGHATRVRHPDDRRSVLVTPTPEATTRAMGTILPVVRAIEGTLESFDEEQRAIINRYLALVVEAYRRELPAQGADSAPV